MPRVTSFPPDPRPFSSVRPGAPRLREPCYRANLVESLRDFKSREFTSPEHFLVDQGQVARARFGYHVERSTIPDAQAIVNVLHGRSPPCLVVGDDAAVAILDVASVPAAFVAEDGHECQLARSLESLLDGRITAVEVRIAVKDEERRAKEREEHA